MQQSDRVSPICPLCLPPHLFQQDGRRILERSVESCKVAQPRRPPPGVDLLVIVPDHCQVAGVPRDRRTQQAEQLELARIRVLKLVHCEKGEPFDDGTSAGVSEIRRWEDDWRIAELLTNSGRGAMNEILGESQTKNLRADSTVSSPWCLENSAKGVIRGLCICTDHLSLQPLWSQELLS